MDTISLVAPESANVADESKMESDRQQGGQEHERPFESAYPTPTTFHSIFLHRERRRR
jgi:hypothetical protein